MEYAVIDDEKSNFLSGSCQYSRALSAGAEIIVFNRNQRVTH